MSFPLLRQGLTNVTRLHWPDAINHKEVWKGRRCLRARKHAEGERCYAAARPLLPRFKSTLLAASFLLRSYYLGGHCHQTLLRPV